MHLFLLFFSVHSLVNAAPYSRGYKKVEDSFFLPEKCLPVKEFGDPIAIRYKEDLAIDLPTLKTSAFLVNRPILNAFAFRELILLPKTPTSKGYTLARIPSIPKLSTPILKQIRYEGSKKNRNPTLSVEVYPSYPPASLNWCMDYTDSFHRYQELLETKRLFRQDKEALSSELSSFIASSTSEYMEAIEWKIKEGFASSTDFSSGKDSSLLVKDLCTKYSFRTPRVFSIEKLQSTNPFFKKWTFTAQHLQETYSLFPEIVKEPSTPITSYGNTLVNSYLEETGFTPIKTYTQNAASSEIDYGSALLAVQSDLLRTKIGERLSLIRLFPVSDHFYISAMGKAAGLENGDKVEITPIFLSTDFLDRELIFPDEIHLGLIPALTQFPVHYKKIDRVRYLSSTEFQSLSIDFALVAPSLKAKKLSPLGQFLCFLSTYKGEDILRDFAISHPFSSPWGSFLSLHDKSPLSALYPSTKNPTSPTHFPDLQQGKILFAHSISIQFTHPSENIANDLSLQFVPLSQLKVSSTDSKEYACNPPLFEKTFMGCNFPLKETNALPFSFQKLTPSSSVPIEESLEATPLFTRLSLDDRYDALLLHSHEEFYIPFIDRGNQHFFSAYRIQENSSVRGHKEDLELTTSFSSNILSISVKVFPLALSPHALIYHATSEKDVTPIYSFLAKGNLSITTSADLFEAASNSSSLIRILPHVHLLETTPFDPLFLCSNASIEINRAHRMIHFELSSLPSLAELDTDSIGDDFTIETKITAEMKEHGYLFSLKLKATDVDFLPPEKHHVFFLVDRNASIEKHRYEIYKKSLLQALTYLDSATSFNIYFFDGGMEKMSPHDVKPTKTAQLLAQKFLQNSPQVKGSSFADFISLMQEIKRTASLSTDMYSVVLLSNGTSMKNIRLNRESLKELLWDWPDSLSLYTTAISDNNNLPMLDLLSKIGKGEFSVAKTHSAFGRKLCTLVRRISKPIAHGIAVTALSEDPALHLEFSHPFSGQLFADRSFAIYGKSSSLCTIDLLLQGRRGDRYINLRKRISLKDAEKGKSGIEKEFYSHLAVHELINFIFSNDQTHLLNAKNHLEPFDSPLTNQL